MKNTKENLGITLIALVITIIVLLILAGVSIGMLSRRQWDFNKGNKCKRTIKNRRRKRKNKVSINGC